MLDLTKESGQFRSGGVGVFAGEKLVHMAPPADMVPNLISDLLQWVKTTDAHPLIKKGEYYEVLAAADRAADSTAFIEFMLIAIRDTLRELIQTEQVKRLMLVLGNETLSAKELLNRLGLKHRPTFSNNYLRPALELGLIEMTVPDKPNSSRQKYRAIVHA